jgi:energy-coupling factor transporter ATP-binding protein EcfA2
MEAGPIAVRNPSNQGSQEGERISTSMQLVCLSPGPGEASWNPLRVSRVQYHMQQILEMAMVLEAGPRLLLLDEPSPGLSPRNQESVFQTVQAIRQAGITVMVVE